jgi:oxalate decarboxylase
MDIVQPIRGEKSATHILPTNPAREAQSSSRLSPPLTDHGTLQNQMVLPMYINRA